MDNKQKYLTLLSEKYPTVRSLSREIINLTAILNLPKGTEHFMSDIHGEYEAFCHILNNCSGVIREKVNRLYSDILSDSEREEICTLIYYPKEKLSLIRKERSINSDWYRMIINHMIEIARTLSSKYTRSKVRKAMPHDYAYIIDELLHAQKDEDDNQVRYHQKILDTIINIDADDFIIALADLIKHLAVDHLHIVGDIFDRGESADKIIDMLMSYHSLDIEWGNHDILWMGAAAGNEACIANVVRNSIKYNTMEILENGYGISLRGLALFAEKTYHSKNPMDAALKAISVIQFKLEGQTILRHPEYEMNDRLLLDKINLKIGTVELKGKSYSLIDTDFPTLSEKNPYELTQDENKILDELKTAFVNSLRLHKHITFLYNKGGMYKCFNNNLLYHGCVPLDSSGNLDGVKIFNSIYKGKAYFDMSDKIARHAYFSRHKNNDEIDFMWYLWCGKKSPLCGRNIKTFERTFIADKDTWYEEKNPYYKFYHTEKICNMILHEFEMYSPASHIVNGHTPVLTGKGEQPIRAGGKLLVIDGGFCKDYHEKTGIAGYTLIYNSHGLRIKAHQPFESVYEALKKNKDIQSSSETIETENHRVMVKDTDAGKQIQSEIDDLEQLLEAYRNGDIET